MSFSDAGNRIAKAKDVIVDTAVSMEGMKVLISEDWAWVLRISLMF